MEAPKPIQTDLGEKPIEEKTYSINSKNKNFNLSIKNFNSFITIYCFYKTQFDKHEFEKKYFLDDFKANKFLSICDSINEVYNQLKIEFDRNNINIKENKENIIIITPINHIKIKEITFILSKKIKNEKEKIEDLKNEISFLKEENTQLKASIEKLENQNKLINDNLINLNKDNKILFEKISKIKKIIEDKNKINNEPIIKNTKILTNNIEKQKVITNWIKEKTGKDNIKYELIFRKSENGNTSNDFHKYCDNKGPTLTIIKTDNKYIIGGFTPLNWEANKKGVILYDQSNQTFIFSLNLMKKYDLIDPKKKRAIYNSKDNGPNFGNSNIRVNNNLNDGTIYDDSSCSFIVNGKKELIGKDKFSIEELEVFKIMY